MSKKMCTVCRITDTVVLGFAESLTLYNKKKNNDEIFDTVFYYLNSMGSKIQIQQGNYNPRLLVQLFTIGACSMSMLIRGLEKPTALSGHNGQ